MKLKDILAFYLEYKMILFPAVVVLSCLILVVFVIVPQLMGFLSGRETQSELDGKLKFLEVKAQSLQSVDGEGLSNKVNTVLGAFPAGRDYVNVMVALRNAVIKWGFTIDSFALAGQDIKIKGVQGYLINLEIKGARALLPSLLNDIESMNRILRVEALQISGSSDTAGVDVSLGIIALYSPAPSSFGSADSPLPELSQKDEEIIAKLTSTANVVETPSLLEEVNIPTGKSNPFE